MSLEKIIIAHCSANADIAAEIAHQLQSTNFQFETIACSHSEQGIQEVLASTTEKVILLLSDNFLKSIDCMDGGLAYLQRLINTGRTLPVVIDGKYPNQDGNGFTTVPTKFERVSSVIKYMNFWQDEYLEMRKQKRFVPSDQEEAFAIKLKSVRAVSSEVGEFLRFLRDSYTCDYETLSANNFQIFFQKFSDQPSYNGFIEQVKQQPVTSLLGTGVAIGAMAGTIPPFQKPVVAPSPSIETKNGTSTVVDQIVAPQATEEELINNEVAEEELINNEVAEEELISNEVVEEELISNEVVEEELISNEANGELPISDLSQEPLPAQEPIVLTNPAEEEIQEETIDGIVKEILQEQSQQATKTADTELLAQELAEKLPSSGIATPIVKEPIEDLVDVETALEDLSRQNIEKHSQKQINEQEAIMQNGLAMLASEEVSSAPKPITESDLLRRSHELIQQGALQDGLTLLEEQLQLRPDMIAARYQYAVFLAQFKQDYHRASEQLQQIIERDAANLPANFFLGELAEAQGDFVSAKQYYETVKAINPNFPNLHYKLGLLLARRYKDQAATANHHLQEAYAQNPRNIDALYNWALVQNESLDQPKAALSAFIKVAAEAPNHPFVNYDIALAHYKLNNRLAAFQFYEKACLINSELKTPENDLAFAVPEHLLKEISNSSNKIAAIQEAETSAVSLNGTTKKVVEELIIPDIIELESSSHNGFYPPLAEAPDYTLDLTSEGQANTIPLRDLIEEETVDIEIDEREIDEEQLEAEFDATIGALGAAGLGIAAGAAIDNPSETMVEESAETFQTEPEITTEKATIPTNVVLITGATSGIGRATATVFAEKGFDLILTGRRFSRLFKLKEELETNHDANIQILPFDVRSAAAVQAAVDDLPAVWKNIDILVNNAGLALGFEPIHEGSLEDWETMIDTNIKGLLYMTRAITPYMVQRQKGHVINISSIAGKEVYPNGNVYCATKHAVEALTKAMRIDLHKYNIRVSQIAPGHVEETEFAKVRFHGDQERAKIYEDFTPVNSKDVAETIHFVATRPPHVNIQDLLVMGTQQASAMITDRSGR